MASIFLGYERDELDQQYDLIGRFGDQYDVFCRLFESLSDQARAAFPSASLDIDCGDGLMIDFYPAAEPAAPVVLFLHGGLWRARGRRDFAMAATGLVPHGASVAIADGCLPQDVGPEAAVENARCAILWLRSHARSLGIDRERLFLLAHGLGAIPAAIALTTDWSLFGEGEEEIVTPVAGLAALSGAFDLEPLRLCFLNAALQLDAAMSATLSPAHLIVSMPRPLPAICLAVGERETDEFHRNMLAFALAAEAAGCHLKARTHAGHSHFSLLALLADPSSSITNELIALVQGHELDRAVLI